MVSVAMAMEPEYVWQLARPDASPAFWMVVVALPPPHAWASRGVSGRRRGHWVCLLLPAALPATAKAGRAYLKAIGNLSPLCG